MTTDSEPRGLPADLEDRLYAAWFDATSEGRAAAVAALLEQHPSHADALRRVTDELTRSDEILAPIAAEPIADRRIGPYLLQETLGEGGFGTVYRAHQLEPVRRVVALKVLRSTGRASSRTAQRFELERDALASMSHSAVAQIYDAGVSPDGRPYFAMELVEGESITRFADRHALGIRPRIELFLAVCAGVTHAHQNGFVHRDLKPSNVLVRGTASAPVPKIIDFGVAKLVDEPSAPGSTPERGLVGTPEYMSPEQAIGANVDTRTDVWGLGVLLFELLTGDLPFGHRRVHGCTPEEVVRIVEREEPRRPSVAVREAEHAELVARHRATEVGTLVRTLRSELDWILRRALARRPADRYAAVSDLARDLERYLSDLPIGARPQTRSYLLRKFVRRHRVVVGIAAALSVSLAVAVGGVVSGLIRATQARDDAIAARNAANMAAGFAALELNRPREVALRLDAVPPTARHWEWQYLASRLDESARVLLRQESTNWHDIAACGAWIVVAATGELAVLPTDGGDVVARRDDLGAHPRLAASPDGSRVAEIDSGGRIRILRVPDLEIERVVAEARPSEGGSLDWSPDGRWLAAGDNVDACTLYPLEGGSEWRVHGLGGDVRPAFHPDGGMLACIGKSGEVLVVDLSTRETLRRFRLLPADGYVFPRALRAAPDGRDYACVTTDGRVHCVDWGASEPRWSVQLASERLSDLVFAPRGLLVVGGYSRPSATLIDRETGSSLLRYEGHASGIDGVTSGTEGSGAFYTVGGDFTVRAWEFDQVEQPVVVPIGRGICDLRFDARGRLVTSSWYGTVRCWNPADGVRLGEAETGRGPGLLAADPQRDRVFVACGNRLETFATPDMELQDSLDGEFEPASVAYLHAADRLVVGAERRVLLFEASPLRLVGTVDVGDGSLAVAARADGRGFVVVDGGGTGATCFDADGTRVGTAAIPAAREVACASHGDLAAATCTDHVLRIWDTRTGRIHGEIAAPTAWGLDWAPDATRIAVGCGDGVVRLLDPLRGMPVVAIRMATGGSGGRFSPNGKHLAAICGPLHGPAHAFVWSIP